MYWLWGNLWFEDELHLEQSSLPHHIIKVIDTSISIAFVYSVENLLKWLDLTKLEIALGSVGKNNTAI